MSEVRNFLFEIKQLKDALSQQKCLVHQMQGAFGVIKKLYPNDVKIIEQCSYIDGLLQGQCAYGVNTTEDK